MTAAVVLLAAVTMAGANLPRPLSVFRPGEVKVGGEIGHRLEVTVDKMLHHTDIDGTFARHFRERKVKPEMPGGFAGYGMFLDALVKAAAHGIGGDETVSVKTCLLDAVSDMVTTNNLFTMYLDKAGFWDNHEGAYLIQALALDHRWFGSDCSLATACRIADGLIDRKAFPTLGSETAYLLLYEETKNPKYLDWLEKKAAIAADIDTYDRTVQVNGVQHVYTWLARALAQVQYADAKGLDANARRPLCAAAQEAFRRARTPYLSVTGSITGTPRWGELWDHTQAGLGQWGETCASAYLMRLAAKTVEKDTSAYYGDLFERILYNAFFSAQSADGLKYRYWTPFNELPPWYDRDTYCCPNNYKREMFEVPAAVFFKAPDGLVVNLYSDAELKSGPLAAKMTTRYPDDGRVRLEVTQSGAARALYLRIPAWCAAAKVSVGGEPAQAVTRGWCKIVRDFSKGLTVELDLPMDVRFVKGVKAQEGRVAVMRGPCVYGFARGTAEKAAHDIDLWDLDVRAPLVWNEKDRTLTATLQTRNQRRESRRFPLVRYCHENRSRTYFDPLGACQPVDDELSGEGAYLPSPSDSEIFSQVELHRINAQNCWQYLADVRAAGIGTVLVSYGDFFDEGANRQPLMGKLARTLRFFTTNGVPTMVWLNGFGYGDARTGVAAKRLAQSVYLTAFDGRTNGAICPTDPVIRQALAENVRDAAKAGARCILMDDDFVQSVRPGLGCVCSNHLALVSRAVGRSVTAEEIRAAFTGKPNALRTVFLDVSGKVAVDLARELRQAVDAVDPSVGMGLCASYTHHDAEGVDLDELLAAFAGGAQPIFRVSGAPYWRNGKYSGGGLDGTLEFVRMQAAWYRTCGYPVLDENDPYPRKTSVVPAWLCELYDKVVIADGGLRRHKYILCYGPDRKETGYLDAHLANQADDATLKRIFAGTQADGVRVIFPRRSLRRAELPTPYLGDKPLMSLYSHPRAGHFLVRNGIPTRYEGEGPAIAFGSAALDIGEAEIRRGLILDREAARILQARGIDTATDRFEVLDFAVTDFDFGKYAAHSHRTRLLAALQRFAGAPLAVSVKTDAPRLYQMVSRNPLDGTYAVLVENLADAPADVRIETAGRPKIVEALRGKFAEGADGLELKALPPHAYAVVRFVLPESRNSSQGS